MTSTKPTRPEIYSHLVKTFLADYPKESATDAQRAKQAKYKDRQKAKVAEIGKYLDIEPVASGFRQTLERYLHKLQGIYALQSEIRHSSKEVLGKLSSARHELGETITASGYVAARDLITQVGTELSTLKGNGEWQDAIKLELNGIRYKLIEHGVISEKDGAQIKKTDARGQVAIMLAALERYIRLIDRARSASTVSDMKEMQALSKDVSKAGVRAVLEAVAKHKNVPVTPQTQISHIFNTLQNMAEQAVAVGTSDMDTQLDDEVPDPMVEIGETGAQIHAYLQEVLGPLFKAKKDVDDSLVTRRYDDVLDALHYIVDNLLDGYKGPQEELKGELKRLTNMLAKQGILSKEGGDKIKTLNLLAGLKVVINYIEQYRRLVDKAREAKHEEDIDGLEVFSKGIPRDGVRSVLLALAKQRNLNFYGKDNNATIFHNLKKSFRSDKDTELLEATEREISDGILASDFKGLHKTIDNLVGARVDNIYLKNALVSLMAFARVHTPRGWVRWKEKLKEIEAETKKKALDEDKLKLGLTNMSRLMANLHKNQLEASLNKVLHAIKEPKTPDDVIAALDKLHQVPMEIEGLNHKNLRAMQTKLRKMTADFIDSQYRSNNGRNNAADVDRFRAQLAAVSELFAQSDDRNAYEPTRVTNFKDGIQQLHELMGEVRKYRTDYKKYMHMDSSQDLLNEALTMTTLKPELVQLMWKIQPNARNIDTKAYDALVHHLLDVVSNTVYTTVNLAGKGGLVDEFKHIVKEFKYRGGDRVEVHRGAMTRLAGLSEEVLMKLKDRSQKLAKLFERPERDDYSPTEPGYRKGDKALDSALIPHGLIKNKTLVGDISPVWDRNKTWVGDITPVWDRKGWQSSIKRPKRKGIIAFPKAPDDAVKASSSVPVDADVVLNNVLNLYSKPEFQQLVEALGIDRETGNRKADEVLYLNEAMAHVNDLAQGMSTKGKQALVGLDVESTNGALTGVLNMLDPQKLYHSDMPLNVEKGNNGREAIQPNTSKFKAIADLFQ